jgi:hypothetical protein
LRRPLPAREEFYPTCGQIAKAAGITGLHFPDIVNIFGAPWRPNNSLMLKMMQPTDTGKMNNR